MSTGCRICGHNVASNGLCSKHYRLRLARGEFGYVDASPAAEHIRALGRLGWAPSAVAKAAGVSHRSATQLLAGRWSRVRSATARAILSVPLVPVDSKMSVDAVGCRRRVEALGRMGWTARAVSEAVGLQPGSLSKILWRGTVSFTTARRIAEFYERNSGTFGGDLRWARKTKTLGYAPPAAWDDADIDDPQSRPNTTGYDEDAVRALLRGEAVDCDRIDRCEAAARLAERGMSRQEIALLIGVNATTVGVYLKEAA